MVDKKLTELAELTSVASGDFLYVVDVSDTTDSSDGTSKKITKSNLVDVSGQTFTSVSITEGTTSSNAVNFGADTNLYRSAANNLKTDDAFTATGITNLASLSLYESGSTNGAIKFGDSAGGYDTNLYRGAANQVKTDDSLSVAGGSIEAGVSDTTAGELTLHGGTGDEGGQINVALGANHDTVFESWNIDTFQDDLRFFTSDAAITNAMTAEGQLKLPGQGSTAGVLLGTDAQMYRSAADTLRTPDALIIDGLATASNATGATAGGAVGLSIGTSGVLGLYFGSGAPTVSAPKGSLYLRTDGSTTNDRAYINTNGTTGWTALTTAA